MALCVAWSAEGAAHGMRGDHGAGHRHLARYVAEGGDIDADRRESGGFEHALDVSHGHVADRSNGYQQHGVDRFVAQALRPVGGDLVARPQLCGGADEGVGVGG